MSIEGSASRAAGSMVILLLVLPSTASAIEPPDAPLPEISAPDLVEKLKAARESYPSGLLEVEFDEEQDDNPDGPPRIVKLPGKIRFIGDGRRWRVDFDSMMKSGIAGELWPRRWSSGFDGSEPFRWSKERNLFVLGEAENEAQGYSPRALFFYPGGTQLESLSEPAEAISQRTVDGHRCYLVVTKYGKSSTETTISPRQGFLPVRQAWFHDGVMYLTYNMRDVREVAPGVWAPGQIFSLSRTGRPADGGEPRLISRRVSHIVRFEPGKTFAATAFRPEIPPRANVTDHRLGYSYRNDPWWPEISAFLRERFDWPLADLSALRVLATHSDARLEGRPAPPIKAATWLNSPPLDWQHLRGKATLVEFWTAHAYQCGQEMAALRRVYEALHPKGLEILSIHSPTDDLEAVRKFARDYRIPFPIVLDAAGTPGTTATAYGIQDQPCAFVVDHEGRVHELPTGAKDGSALVNGLLDLLEKAGVQDLPSIPENPGPTAQMIQALGKEFNQRVAAAPATGRIRGTVRDAAQRPIAGAKITAALRLTLLVHGVNATFEIHGRSAEAASDQDGRFEVPGLCKGTYAVTYTARGKAAVEERTTVAADLAPATDDATLDQGDAIEGIIRDAAGQPVAGAAVTPTFRRLRREGNTHTTTADVDAVTTDAAGRFRIERLRVGEYNLDVTARGFEPQTLEWIPAGSIDVKAALKRPKPM